jgi:hypothetical protein
VDPRGLLQLTLIVSPVNFLARSGTSHISSLKTSSPLSTNQQQLRPTRELVLVDVIYNQLMPTARHSCMDSSLTEHRHAFCFRLCLHLPQICSAERMFGETNSLAQVSAFIRRAVALTIAASLFLFSLENNIMGGLWRVLLLMHLPCAVSRPYYDTHSGSHPINGNSAYRDWGCTVDIVVLM